MSTREQRSLLEHWNDTSRPYERDASIPEVFENQAQRNPDAIAVELGARRLTYRELDQSANRFAHRLRAAGVGREVRVAVAAERSIEAIVSFLAVLKAGGAYVPLDPEDPTDRLQFILRDTDSRVVVAQQELVDRVPVTRAPMVVSLDAGLNAITDGSPEPIMSSIGPRDLAYVMYTSGSTGTPKGVAVEHRGVIRYMRSANELMPRQGEGMLHCSQLDFDNATFEIWGALLNGARLVIHPPGRVDPSLIGRTIREHDVNVAAPVTGLFHQMVDRAAADLTGPRLLVIGGDVMSPHRAARFLESHPGCRLVNDYGPTEGTVSSSWYEVRSVSGNTPIPIGRPLPNTRLYVLDAAGAPVDPGTPGELWIGGDGVARGYINLPHETAARFHPDPFVAEPGARMYRSGDRVRLRGDGELEFVGRIDGQVKIRGYRIEPSEIDAQLEACPDVAHAVVAARADVPGHVRLVAYIVPTLQSPGAAVEARRFLQERLPDHMVPSAFVILDQLPRTAAGEVDRDALPAPADFKRHEGEGRTPRDEYEEAIALVWREVLRIPGIGIDDDFLELGGDSLLAVQVLIGLRERLGVELPVDAVFQERTILRLASRTREVLGRGPTESRLPHIRRGEYGGDVPVSPAQAQACFEAELADDALPYQFQALIHLRGRLDTSVLQRALSEIIRRHEILRTRFPKQGGTWLQVVEAPFDADVPLIDLRRDEDPTNTLQRIVDDAFHTQILPDDLPLTRWTLVRVADEHHVLIHVEHHLVHDGWAWTVFLRELVDLYGAEVEGRPSALEAPSIQFRDFTTWQRELSQSALGRDQLDYWTRRLQDLPPPLSLPTDRPRPLQPTYRGDEIVARISPALAEALRAVSRASGVTLFMTMFAAFLAMLRSYTGEDDLVVGSGVANRRLRETEGLLGMVLNTVALRTDLSDDPTVGELLERVAATTLDAYAHQDVPYERVLEHVAPERHAGYAPLYQVLFSFHDSPLPAMQAGGVVFTADDTPGNGSAKSDLNIVVINRRMDDDGAAQSGELTVIWEFRTDLFDPETAARMLDSYRTVLEAFVESPEQRLSEVRVVGDADRRAIVESAGSVTPYERDASVVEVFARQVAATPDSQAVVGDGVALSYGELNRRANQLSHRLIALGVSREARVAVLAERAPDTIVALLAILKAGGAYVALDPSWPVERLRLLLDDTQASVVCVDDRWNGRLPPGGPPMLPFDDPAVRDAPVHDPDVRSAPTDLAYVAYTSGSTGTPKGVEIPHRAVVRLVRGTDYVDLDQRETLLAMAPLAFDASTFEVWGALLNGARLAVAPPVVLAPAEIAEIIERYGVTTIWLTAGVFHQFVDQYPDGLRRVRQLIAGGDVLSPRHVNRALRLLPEGGVLVNGYGPTEGTTFTCCFRMPAGHRVSGPIPIGLPIPNTTVYVLDAHGEPVAPGVTGELYIGGDGVARGYLGRPDLTRERFVPDHLGPEPDARLYRTGDLGRRRRDGVIEFAGRVDRQVKIRGFRVEPGAVEHALAQHPSVRDAAIVARSYGSDDLRLVAYVTPANGSVTPASLRAFLAERLPAYELPAAWVTMAQLPLTANGKLDRDALPEPAAERHGAPTVERSPTRLEQKMTAIWESVLGLAPIGLTDDFFDLGGHSLLAVELFARIQRVLGPRLPLASIFEAPTVEQLAEVVRREGWEAPWSSLVALNAGGSRRPFFCVAAGDGNTVGYGALARHLSTEQPFYALQPRGLDGRRMLQTSVTAMADHYLCEIRTVQPAGPYLLGGRCLGALVAYEMARLLERDGQEVRLLVVLDSLGPHWVPRHLANGLLFDEIMNLARLRASADGLELGDIFDSSEAAEAFVAWLRASVVTTDDLAVNRYLFEAYRARPDVRRAYRHVPGSDVGRLIDWGWVSGRREMGMSEVLLPPPTEAASGLRPPRTSVVSALGAGFATRALDWIDVATRGRLVRLAERRERRLQAVSVEAADQYRAGAYRGRIALLRSTEFLGDVEIARWHGLDSGGVEERIVAGTHRSMVREPDVTSLAATLEECIDDALDDATRTRT